MSKETDRLVRSIYDGKVDEAKKILKTILRDKIKRRVKQTQNEDI